MHQTLLSGVRGKEKAPGEFCRVQVAIGMNSRFIPPPSGEVPACLDALERHLHKTTAYDPLIDCFLTHYRFETIHPFMDGNGRVGRLLLALMIQTKCGLTKPWLYMSGYFEKNREEYCQRLFNVSAEGAWDEWIDFCLRGAIEQAEETVKRCDKIRSIRETYMQKLPGVGGSIRLNQIVEDLFRSPFARIPDIAGKLDVTYPTAKADVDRLVKAGILRELKNISQKTFYAPDVYNAAYGDIDDI
jgi:Fic family protein